MADNGYSDGSVVVSTDLDTQGFEAGSDRMKGAVDSSIDRFRDLGEAFKDAVDAGTQAVRDAAPVIDESMRDCVNTFQTSSEDIQGWIDKWAEAIPEKKFESSLSAINKMIDDASNKMSGLERSYTNAADGGSREISKFENQAATLETVLDKIGTKIENIYGTGVKTQNGEIFNAKDSESLTLLIGKFDDLQKALAKMQVEIIKVKTEAERAKAAEAAAAERAKARTDALRQSNRQMAEENKQAYQSLRQEIRAADSETRAFDSTSKSIGNSIRSLENKIFALGPAARRAMRGNENAVESFEYKVANTERQIQYLRERLEALGNARITSNEYDELNAELLKARETLQQYINKRQDLINRGDTDRTSNEWFNVNMAIHAAQNAVDDYEQRLEELRNNGGDVISGTETEAYSNLSSSISQMEREVTRYESRVARANRGTNALVAILKGAGKVGITAFKGIGKAIAWTTNKIKSFRKHSNSSMNVMKKLTKVFTSFGARIKSLLKRRFISALISGATEGIKNLAQVSPELNAAMSSLMTALDRLKNSFATAFAPIITAVAPILTTFINLLSEAFTKIGMFISALTGATSFKKATTVQKDYAASLNDTSKAADKANKSLAGFDELNNTTSSEKEDSETTNPEDMFEDVAIDSKIADIAKKLKDLFTSGDFEGLGAMLAGSINDIVQKINEAVDWNNIGPKITAFVDGLTRTFNSLVDNINWTMIGDTVAKGVNTIVNTIYLLATGIDWANLGKKLMDGLNGFVYGVDWNKLGKTIGTLFQSAISFLHAVVHNFDFKALAKGLGDAINSAFAAIDWSMAGDTISTGLRGIIQFLSTAVKTIDWKQIGKDIADLLNAIDWVGIFGDLATLLSDLLIGALDLLLGICGTLDWEKLGHDLWDSLVAIVTNIDWTQLVQKTVKLLSEAFWGLGKFTIGLFDSIAEAFNSLWEDISDYFVEKAEEAGGNLWDGVLYGIADAITGIGDWLYTNVVEPFIEGFCEVFGIHSPSTVMAELGGYIIEGLKNGIVAAWNGIKTFFTNAWNNIKSICTNTWNNIKNATKNAWNNVTSTISTAASNIKSWISDKFTAAKDVISSRLATIKNNISTGFTTAYNTIATKVSNIKNTIATGFSNMYSTVSNKVHEMGTNIAAGFSNIHSAVSDKLYEVGSAVFNTFSNLISNAWSWGSDICANIANGIYAAAQYVSDSVSYIGNVIKDFLGFSEPDKGPLSDFHTYMPDMLQLMADGIYKNKSIAVNAVSDLAAAISDEAQDTNVLVPINAESKYTRFLDTFSESITDAFTILIDKLEAIAQNVTFAVPAVAEGTVLPYKVHQTGADEDNNNTKNIDLSAITSRLDAVVNTLIDVVEAIDSKPTGITDEAVYNSVKQSVRRETKSTGRNPFAE